MPIQAGSLLLSVSCMNLSWFHMPEKPHWTGEGTGCRLWLSRVCFGEFFLRQQQNTSSLPKIFVFQKAYQPPGKQTALLSPGPRLYRRHSKCPRQNSGKPFSWAGRRTGCSLWLSRVCFGDPRTDSLLHAPKRWCCRSYPLKPFCPITKRHLQPAHTHKKWVLQTKKWANKEPEKWILTVLNCKKIRNVGVSTKPTV